MKEKDPETQRFLEYIGGGHRKVQFQEIAANVGVALSEESDRGFAILCASLVHDDLKTLLMHFFQPESDERRKAGEALFEGYAPLSSFSACIEVAFAMGLLTGRVRYKSNLLRKIRNEFAHAAGPKGFDDPRIAGRLDSFFARASDTEKDLSNSVPDLVANLEKGGVRINPVRMQFSLHVAAISSTITFVEDTIRANLEPRAMVKSLDAAGI